ncbi:ABC-type nitrate/sulfonate/bicarbonate transport system, substrate-binding protein [Gordonia westfalica]|uniref:ABC-type nitrate/sulfonate/bicarbonate transport system, substrate-binding protein n=2 Tax=Gordonia westfalica TaxID=158898 RepID=A0A1H2KXY6_9ACTN|nr:ABC-type nitrate/sulfonate/bicarbonate transport system, substrate-binding protein [Gordonia westfalica]
MLNRGLRAWKQRRMTRGVLAAGTVGIAVGALLTGCGSGENEASSAAANEALTSILSNFTPAPGDEVPNVDVKFAMWPYGDTTIGFIGIEKGWFKEAGINLEPAQGQTQLDSQTSANLVSGALDTTLDFLPTRVNKYEQQPSIKSFGVTNMFIGNYVLASPSSGLKPLSDFLVDGADFNAAVSSVVDEIQPERIALSDQPAPHNLLNALLSIADKTTGDLKNVQVLEDTKIVNLAKGGGTDVAMVSGAAQAIQLLNMGFTPIFAFQDLADNLPAGDDRVAAGVGHVSLAATSSYIGENLDTVLRFQSVYWRIIDYIQTKPEEALAVSLPHLNQATGFNLSLEESMRIFRDFYQMVGFGDSAKFYDDPTYPLGLGPVYEAQIATAKGHGVIKGDVSPTDFVVGGQVYHIMNELKTKYDQAVSISTASDEVKTKAQAYYDAFNFLDAYRTLSAASPTAQQ